MSPLKNILFVFLLLTGTALGWQESTEKKQESAATTTKKVKPPAVQEKKEKTKQVNSSPQKKSDQTEKVKKKPEKVEKQESASPPEKSTPDQKEKTKSAAKPDQEKPKSEKIVLKDALTKPETIETKDGLKIETVSDVLIDPMAIAVHPTTAEIYVADSGALRIVRIKNGKIEPVVTGFKKQDFGMDSGMEVGPLAFAFLDPKHLIVAVAADNTAASPNFSVYALPESGKPPADAAKPKSSHGLTPKKQPPKSGGIGYGMVATGEGVYATTTMESDQGWILRADRIKDGVSDFQRLVATKEKSNVGTPMAITRAFEVGYFAVGEIGTFDTEGDSVLSYYDESGKRLGQSFKTGLNDISGLAFGPKRGRLFAIDYSAMDPSKGGLFKLVAEGTTGCRADKLADLTNPTAMAFDKKGDLYITLRATNDNNPKSGKLVKIAGLDKPPKPKKSTAKPATK